MGERDRRAESERGIQRKTTPMHPSAAAAVVLEVQHNVRKQANKVCCGLQLQNPSMSQY